MRGQLKLLLTLCIITLPGKGFSTTFNELLFSGKWANAKLWLLQNREKINRTEYYIKHLQVGYFLNEQELCKAYCDSLESTDELHSSPGAQITYNILRSKYYQYYRRQHEALLYAEKACELARQTGNEFSICIANAQVAIALRFSSVPSEVAVRNAYIKRCYEALPRLHDSLYLYKSKLIQALALIEIDKLSNGANTAANRDNITKILYRSNEYILAKQSNHPQLVHNYLLLGFIRVAVDVDSALKYYKKAEDILAKINDVRHGIYIYHASSFIHLMEVAYEIKYKKSGNEDYLNKAIVWAKQNLELDELKRQYEGYYLYRRFTDHYNPPPEQRIAKLYLVLYNKTRNNNYLSFATKYAEYFRHKPIMQTDINARVFGLLKNMAQIENGAPSSYKTKTDYANNIITKPEAVAHLLKPNQAIIAYFSYLNEKEDSVSFMIECIESSKNFIIVQKYSRKEIDSISSRIYNSIDNGDAKSYKQSSFKAYQYFLKSAISHLDKKITHLHIIPPAYFNTPLQFDGFLVSERGHDFKNFEYVFDNYNVSYFTSFTHFVQHNKPSIRVNHVSVWNPDYSQTPLAELTENEKINSAISKHFSVSFINCNNKPNLLSKLLKGNIVQISGHADASFDDLRRPRIYTGLPVDSTLLDIDLERLDATADLVIYAACKSNVGNVQHNGMIDGFTRATLSSGAGGTICTVFNVEESATAELLELFYNNLAKGYSSSEALYIAKTHLKKTNPDPKLWQAYIYTGAEQSFVSKPGALLFSFYLTTVIAFAGICFLLLKTNLY